MRCFNLLLSIATLCVGLMSLLPPMVHGIPRRRFYPFGTDEGDSVLPRFDNGASEAIPVIPGFTYFGSSYTNLYVSLADIILYVSMHYTVCIYPLYCMYLSSMYVSISMHYTVCIYALYCMHLGMYCKLWQ